jgi:hypothetical protein
MLCFDYHFDFVIVCWCVRIVTGINYRVIFHSFIVFISSMYTDILKYAFPPPVIYMLVVVFTLYMSPMYVSCVFRIWSHEYK